MKLMYYNMYVKSIWVVVAISQLHSRLRSIIEFLLHSFCNCIAPDLLVQESISIFAEILLTCFLTRILFLYVFYCVNDWHFSSHQLHTSRIHTRALQLICWRDIETVRRTFFWLTIACYEKREAELYNIPKCRKGENLNETISGATNQIPTINELITMVRSRVFINLRLISSAILDVHQPRTFLFQKSGEL